MSGSLDSKCQLVRGSIQTPGFDGRGCGGVVAVVAVLGMGVVADDEMGLGGKRVKGRGLKMRRDSEERKKRKGRGGWQGKNDGQRVTEVRMNLGQGGG